MNQTLPLVADLLLAFNLGLVSQLHCVGMCGGVVAALGLAIAPQSRAARGALPFALAYNGGRVTSYALAGVLLGTLGAGLVEALASRDGHLWLRIAAAVMLVASGLALFGLPQAMALVERAGYHVWRRLQPLARGLLPVRHLRGAWLFGMLWGWLPCALVYAALAHAAASASATRAALLMVAFGLGTMPALVLAAVTAARAGPGPRTDPRLRRAAGAVLVVCGCLYPFVGVLFSGAHAHH